MSESPLLQPPPKPADVALVDSPALVGPPISPSSNPPIQGGLRRPGWGFAFSHPAHAIALAFGAGLSPKAPGTVGTLWAWAAYSVMAMYLSAVHIGGVIAASALIGWWACTVTAQHMRVQDPGSIVWDEVIAFWLVLWLLGPSSFWAQLVAFALFRFFDAVKPGPVAWADARFKGYGWRGGFGIVFDDLVAAFCTLLVIALWRF